MNKEEYEYKKRNLEEMIQDYIDLIYNVEMEYRIKLSNDLNWIKFTTIRDQKKAELQSLKNQWYDDNRVFRTGERTLSVRLDRATKQDKACKFIYKKLRKLKKQKRAMQLCRYEKQKSGQKTWVKG